MSPFRFRRRQTRSIAPSPSLRRRGFETLEDRRLLAVDVAASTFSPGLMGDAIEFLATGNAVGFGYAINQNGVVNAAVGSGGLARTAADASVAFPVRNFSSLVEMEVSSVSKPITATAILHALEDLPGSLDDALKTKLVDYLPSDWVVGANIGTISLRHLLTHASGFGETTNAIGVNFESYGNNTYANLKALVQAGLPAPNVPADDVYDAPRWDLNIPGGNYNNANFTLLARVVLPKLISPGLDLTAAAFPGVRDAVSGAIYKSYVKSEIFDPLGITGADMTANDANPAKGYTLGVNAPGLSMTDYTSLGGAFGWKLSARELATFLDGVQRDNSILAASTRQMRDDQNLGWFTATDQFGEYHGHNGATSGGGGAFRSKIETMPGGIEVAYLMNSDDANLPGGSDTTMLRTAYVNGWTDLVVAGTSGPDSFQATMVVDNGHDAIRVTLNGVTQFTRWLDGLDSITLNGGLGNDTFTVSDWDSSVQLIINGGSNDDTVNLLSGLRNIELVSGMSFNGGTGTDSLFVYDQNNPYSMPGLSQQYQVSSTSVSRFRGLTIPNNPTIPVPVAINYAAVENLEVTTGGQADLVTLASKTTGVTELRTGNGNDVVQVIGGSNLENVNGLFVDGQTGTDSIEFHDENKVIGAGFFGQYDLDADSVSRYVTGGFIINPNPPVYSVDFASMENVALTTSDGDDRIRVHQTTSGEVVVNGGAGADILYAAPNGKNLELVRDLTFNGDAGIDGIVLNDQDNPYSHSLSHQYAVSAAQTSRSMAGFLNLALSVDVSYSSVENATLYAGDQADVIDVASTTSGDMTIHAGAGADVVNASSNTQKIESVNDLTVDGGLGSDTLNVLDANNPYDLGPGGGVYTIDTDSIGRYAEHLLFPNVAVPLTIDFSAVENVSLDAGTQTDKFRVDGQNGPASLTLKGNNGGDEFTIDGPAYGTINVQGASPIFAPGDVLRVNQPGLYPTANIPGLYIAGSGGVTIGATSVYFSGIETSEVQSQIYGGPGDFDSNGIVEGLDLTHATLGWNHRFGSDLGGFDFLTWQRHFGENRLPVAEAPAVVAAIVVDEASGGGDDPFQTADAVALAATALWTGDEPTTGDDEPAAAPVGGDAPAYVGPRAFDAALADVATDDAEESPLVEVAADDASLDAAFAAWEPAAVSLLA